MIVPSFKEAIMDSEAEDPRADTFDKTEEPAEQSRRAGRRRYVLYPMLRSGAIAACVVAIAIAGAIGIFPHAANLPALIPAAGSVTDDSSATHTAGDRRVTAEADEIAANPLNVEPGAAEADESEARSSSADEAAVDAKADISGQSEDGATSEAPVAAPAPGGVSTDAGSGGSSPSGGSGSGHQHAWTPEMKTVDHAAEYKDVPHEAAYEKKKWTQCNACLDDITGNVAGHIAAHAAAGEPASYHTEESSICVKEAWVEKVLVKEAYSEEVPTGAEVCSCGARR